MDRKEGKRKRGGLARMRLQWVWRWNASSTPGPRRQPSSEKASTEGDTERSHNTRNEHAALRPLERSSVVRVVRPEVGARRAGLGRRHSRGGPGVDGVRLGVGERRWC